MIQLDKKYNKRFPNLHALPKYIGGNFINPLSPPNISYPSSSYSYVINTNSIQTIIATNTGGPIVSVNSNPNINSIFNLFGSSANLNGNNGVFHNATSTNYTINAINTAGTGSTNITINVLPAKFMFFNQFNKHLILQIVSSSTANIDIPTGSNYRYNISSSNDANAFRIKNPTDNGFIHIDYYNGSPSADFTSVSWSLDFPNLSVSANTTFGADPPPQQSCWVAVTVHNIPLGPTIVT